MNAITDNAFSRSWREWGKTHPRPRAILCISAHWLTEDVRVTAVAQPRTIHDFGGFPQELHRQQYPAPGNPDLARELIAEIKSLPVQADLEWGLDHGCWSVLLPMYPAADIPVLQVSLAIREAPEFHYALGRELRRFTREDVLILGSGNIVHNIRAFQTRRGDVDTLQAFDDHVVGLIQERRDEVLLRYASFSGADLAVPTPDHFLPLFTVLGAADPDADPRFFNRVVEYGAVSMTSFHLG